MNRVRAILVSAATIGTLCGVTACSGSGGGGTQAASVPPTTTSSTSSVASAPATATSSPPTAGGGPTSSAARHPTTSTSSAHRSSGSSGPSPCAESQLRANAAADPIPGLSQHVVKLTFKNTSGSACTLTGFPGAAIVDSSGHQVRQARRVEGGPVGGTIERSATLTLRPGRTAFAYLEGSSTREQGAAQAGCDGPKCPRILVTPPNPDTPVPFTLGWPQCYSFEVHPVRTD